MSVSINGTSGLTFNDGSAQTTAASGFGFKNRLINGAMVIDQRNAGASVTQSSGGYTLDRWQSVMSVGSKFSVQQNAGSVTPPAGYKYYLGVTSTSAYSVGAADYFDITQNIEGYNWADLGFGAAGASSVTFSFWVRSSLTGTFSGTLTNSNDTQVYPFSYTISAANTWEQKSITIAGSTSGTWNTTNGVGAKIQFALGLGSNYLGTLTNTWNAGTLYGPTGQVNVVATNGATFYITGVQLEKGSTATSFDYRPYGTELALCQRYYQTWGGTTAFERVASGFNYSGTNARTTIPLVVTMRATPTLTVSAASDWAVESAGATTACNSIALDQASPKVAATNFNVASGLTGGQGVQAMANNTLNARLNLSAEL